MSVDQRLAQLKIVLPAPPTPVATYIPACRAGDLLFVSGVLPSQQGQILVRGKLGREVSVQQGYQAARLALLNGLAIVRQELGSLDRVKRIVRIVGYVASAEGFTEQPAVVNGASDCLVQVFGDIGKHARLALGAAELPLGAPIELELIVQVSEGSASLGT